ncbi:MAG TPA: single-stranded DNA-binding protein [Chthoniobacteraceae bacterium]|nr:single-stranded DNA-binding protein [Chthoniobacteraceae bacterium]
MANLNKVMLIGNLTRDPDVRYTPKGTAVAELGLAVNRRYTVDGEKREETTFVDITLWGRTAELAGQYLRKGRSIYIEGRLQFDTWDDKQTGQKRSKLRVIGDEMQFLGGRDGESGGAPRGGGGGEEYEPRSEAPRYSQRPQGRPTPPPKPPADPDLDVEDDDIPF